MSHGTRHFVYTPGQPGVMEYGEHDHPECISVIDKMATSPGSVFVASFVLLYPAGKTPTDDDLVEGIVTMADRMPREAMGFGSVYARASCEHIATEACEEFIAHSTTSATQSGSAAEIRRHTRQLTDDPEATGWFVEYTRASLVLPSNA